MKKIARKWILPLAAMLCGASSTSAQQSANIIVSAPQLPALTPCSGIGTFIIRLKNISAAPINNIVVRDSMPPGISYVSGSVSGTDVSFGVGIAPNVVTFNVSSLAASDTVDIAFDAVTDCSVSRTASDITNTYRVNWGSLYAAPFKTATYNVLFPSLSITPGSTSTYNASCLTPFVRSFTICNGGFGAVDSVNFSDSESNGSLVIQGFSNGTASGLNTRVAKTVLSAADFMTVGNGDGKLDQNECIVLYDTLLVIGSTSPITGTYTSSWGCNGISCSNPASNTYTLMTTVNASSPLTPALTRSLVSLGPPDSPGNIYSRPVKYLEIVQNNSQVTAVNAKVLLVAYGLKYINTDSVWVSKNGGARYHPPMYHYANKIPYAWSTGTPADYAASLTAFPNSAKPSNEELTLGDLAPGDSVAITVEVGTAGPLTRVNSSINFDHNSTESGCGVCARVINGAAIAALVDANMSWQGCPAGTFNACSASSGQTIYNGLSAAPLTEADIRNSNRGHLLANFGNYSTFTDFSNQDGHLCAHFENDTIPVMMQVNRMDLPFYTDRSKFFIKIYTNGGVKWSGNLNRVTAKLWSWSSSGLWYADNVVDSTDYDNTIRIYFKRSNCPIPDFRSKDAYNSYRMGIFQLFVDLVNTCPGPAQKRLYMTRCYTIDTTSGEPGIEAGTNTFPANWTWNSQCAGACSEGATVLNYSFARTTFGAPDNDQNGVADANGSLDGSNVATDLITWGDTVQLKYKLLIHTTSGAGVPSLYINSAINYSVSADAVTCNGMLSKYYPSIVINRPGVGTYTGTGSSIPANNNNSFLTNLSLQGAGGVAIPGITTYLDGDTVYVTLNMVYNQGHSGWGLRTWSFQHVPFTATVLNPTLTQQIRCDSTNCNFRTVDMAPVFDGARVTAVSCSDSVTFRWHIAGQPYGSNCGTNYFPYESRNIYVPVMAKIAIPAASNFTLVRIRFYWDRNIFGTGGNQCQRTIDKYLQPGDYSFNAGGDTLLLDFRQICAGSGFDYKQVNLYSGVYLDITVRYNQSVSGCTKDHLRPGYTFPILYYFETSRPMITAVNPAYYSGARSSSESGGETPATLQWPGVNNNIAALYAGSSITATQSNVVVPVRYTVINTSGLTGNCWMAIPGTGGVTVDSVKIKTTGVIVPQTPPGSNIYQLGDLGGNGATRDYDVYTHLVQCINTPLNIYADRTPCTGYPVSWASYACQASAKVSTFTYTTFPGELQMSDSLFYVNKDICTDDTVQFSVVNSQTQTTRNIKINLTLPAKMSIVPGRTYLSYGGTNNFILTQDPVLNGGTYTWTMPAADTLAPIAQAPDNLLYLRVALTTDCGFKSGSQIYSAISGDVACGPVTRLFNANPAPLRINGAPSLSYFTNPKATVTQLTSCGLGPAGSQPIRLAMHISGGKTGADDSVQFILPEDYVFISYDPSNTGSHNAPAGQPAIEPGPDSGTLLSWASPPDIVPGDSIVFSFFYNEKSNSNKCNNDRVRKGYLGTYITSGVFCIRTNAVCPISIANGTDTTAQFQTIRPDLSVRLDSVFFGPGSAPDNPYRSYHSSLHIKGVIKNAGPGSILPDRPIYMENFIDIDNSATINKADSQYNTYVYIGGLAAGDSIAFEFWDSTSHRYCITCYQKALLTRFSDTATKPAGATQCLCDSSTVQVTPQTFIMLPLGLTITDFSITQKNCNTVEMHWKNVEHPSPGDLFKIRISPDGAHFKDIQTIAAVDPAGTSYTRTVVLPAGVSYLKLGQLSNGKRYCTPTKKFVNTCSGKKNGLEVYPNPCWDGAPLVVKVEEATGGTIALQALTTDGKLIKSREYNVEAGLTEFGFADVASQLPGSFIVRVQHADGSYSAEKVIKR